MRVETFPLSPPSLEELAAHLRTHLAANYTHASVGVVRCPDLRAAPFHLATEGLSGDEKIADVGGQPNLFPRPRLDAIWSLPEVARAIGMSSDRGGLIGAGAGPFHVLGQNSELAPNLGWSSGLGENEVDNRSRVILMERGSDSGGDDDDGATRKPKHAVRVRAAPSTDCGLMANLFGSRGEPGPVLRITARGRKGPEKSFTECIRQGLRAAYGDERTVSLGGAFVVRAGRATYHVMPDFPAERDLPFRDRGAVEEWLTFHDFDAPVVGLSVLHSADPPADPADPAGGRMALRMEHTHASSAAGEDAGGHYHFEAEGEGGVIEYEGYFNTAKTIYRVDRPAAAAAAVGSS
ncbi:Ester hydrolase C11orf54 -like protein [Colletotrichum tanaceti]|uniref:Ester hydrolase C11orf54-like protein n=1 Tax=Colletotrichum tanaceti TaxID=1306861 RepID=A0A4V6DG59_9PEZI|nr:Ester hydrolase C11orf54 -like protein [Colletotrichum tanaceti]TKW51626.1 Ester hydrolase C11orf54 -like protein [Colletotrichum tanaceti]